jgi:adenylate cyclase
VSTSASWQIVRSREWFDDATTSSRRLAVERIRDWLVAGAPGASGSPAVFQRFCDDLRAAGVPIDRACAYVRTLHPHIVGRSFTWSPGKAVQVGELGHERSSCAEYLASPVKVVQDTRCSLRVRLERVCSPAWFPVCDDLVQRGFTDYFAAPLEFLDGTAHGVTFATKRRGGFSDEDVAALERLMVPLARVAEILALSRTAVSLLNTYVGHDAGGRILAGKIRRGDFDTMRAVIWCSDLRGFTTLAGSVPPAALLRALDEVFECQVPSIEQSGGEVLKFMGDGLLAIFPIVERGPTTAELCDRALDAAANALGALARVNGARADRREAPIRLGLALHVGEVAYGNIGASARLDFTCIGPAVNLAARLEGLTGRLDRPVVASADFSALTSRRMEEVGAFELKGFAEPQRVFAPTGSDVLSRW